MNRSLVRSLMIAVIGAATAAFPAPASAGSAAGPLVNGGFETGDFTGWTRSAFTDPIPMWQPTDADYTYDTYIASRDAGTATEDDNAVVTAQTEPFGDTPGTAIGPTAGSHMAFISSARSAGTLVGSSISQTFTVSAGVSRLSVDLRFLSIEGDGSNLDFGGVALVRDGTVLGQFILDNDSDGVADAHTSASDAGGFVCDTGWRTAAFDLTGLAGQEVTVVFFVTNTGDNIVESRLLIDNVREVFPPAFPNAPAAATAAEGSPFMLFFATTGLPSPAVTLSGTLPSGLGFADGVLSGTPADGAVGEYILTLTADNGVGSPATLLFALTVSDTRPASVALYRLCEPGTATHLLTVDANECSELASMGWTPEGVGALLYSAPGIVGRTPTVPLRRLCLASAGTHLLTADAVEADSLVEMGGGLVIDEGVVGHVLPPDADEPGTVPLWRLYLPSTGDHLLTADPAEAAFLPGAGWVAEGIAALVPER
jgi:hypothetical protein